MTQELLRPSPIDGIRLTPVELTPETVLDQVGPYIGDTDHLPIERERLEGKSVLVTGSTRGIGRETAKLFASFGANVVIHGRPESEPLGRETVDSIVTAGGKALWLGADITDASQADGLVKTAAKELGGLDIVVHNAGTTGDNLAMIMTEAEWKKAIATNLDSAFYITKPATREMRKRGGRLVYASSLAQFGFPGQSNYSASKRGIEAFADTIAREYGFKFGEDGQASKSGLTVGIYRIGLVDTELTSGLTDAQREHILQLTPSHKAFSPEEAARGLVYLSSIEDKKNIQTLTLA